MTDRKYTKAEIRFYLETNDKWLYRGLIAIYNRQTEDEKNAGITRHDNSVGFSGADSSFLSNAAKFLKERGFLTAKQRSKVRQAMLKYAGQLEKIANKLI